MKRIDHYRDTVWNSDLSSNEKLLLLAMARVMDHDTLGDCRPGTDLLARWTGLDPRTVQRIRGRLVAAGWLERVTRGGSPKGGRRLASVYRGTIPDLRHGATSTYGTGAPDLRHGATPPSQGPGATNGADAPVSPNHAPRSVCEYCHGLPLDVPCIECRRQEAS